VLLAANLAQQHAAQLLPPVNVLGIVLLNQAVKVALSLVIRRAVQLRLSRSIPQRPALLVYYIMAVGPDGKDGPELGQWLRHGCVRREECVVGDLSLSEATK
jgi:hypothetical protein